jgi:hypothetical protein
VIVVEVVERSGGKGIPLAFPDCDGGRVILQGGKGTMNDTPAAILDMDADASSAQPRTVELLDDDLDDVIGGLQSIRIAGAQREDFAPVADSRNAA